MKIETKEYTTLQKLEESLWIAETRFNQEYMEKILAPGFFEFDRSGRIYQREEVLSVPTQKIIAVLPLKNFAVRLITEDVAQVTYISEVTYAEVEMGQRSSLWIKTPQGWQLKFHQGTPVTL